MESTTNTSAYMDAFNSSAATFAADIDNAFFINLWVSVVLGLSVLLPMVYFAWKYRESNVKDEDIENLTHHTGLEITWTVIPTIILMVMFWYGYDTMKTLRTMPDANNAITIQVEGSKWKWRYLGFGA
jgi:cytochrome c oxidase subunit 2